MAAIHRMVDGKGGTTLAPPGTPHEVRLRPQVATGVYRKSIL